jgi:hypothetical protein
VRIRHRDDLATKQFSPTLANLRTEKQSGGLKAVTRKKMITQLIGDLLWKN